MRIRRSRNEGLDSCWSDVLTLAHGATGEGAHIIAFHPRESDRPSFERYLRDRHRISWLDKNTIQQYGTCVFTERVREISQFELSWRDKLRPSISSALMLPEPSFVPHSACANMWTRVRRVSLERDDLHRVRGVVDQFTIRHRHVQGSWKDADQKTFTKQEYHAGEHLEEEWFWKFTAKLPRGFHFNVSRPDGRPMDIRDLDGHVVKRTVYANVDPHGSVFGGR